MNLSSIPQLYNKVIYNFESDTNAPQTILTSSDSAAFMMTSPDSPPIGYVKQNKEQQMNDINNFVSHKSTPKTEIAVKRINALNEDTSKHNNPLVVYLDTDNLENNSGAIKAIEQEKNASKGNRQTS